MIKKLEEADARDQLTRNPDIFEENPEIHAVEVQRKGKPIFAVIPAYLYEQIADALEDSATRQSGSK